MIGSQDSRTALGPIYETIMIMIMIDYSHKYKGTWNNIYILFVC